MTKNQIFRLAALAFLISHASPGMATPGAVDGNGCHASQKIGFHCHPQRAGVSGGADGSKKDREKRLKKECKGAVNAGACTGYTGKK